MRINLVAAILLAVAALTSGLAIQTDADSYSITGQTQGQAYVWAVNDFASTATISFTASASHVTASLDKARHSAAVDGVAGTVVRFYAPPAFRGTDYITIQAQACAGDGTCVTATKKIEIRVEAEITQNEQIGQPQRYTKSAPEWGSVTYYGAAFDPTSYNVDIQSRTSCIKIGAGSRESERLLLLNRGAAGSFNIRAFGDKKLIDAELTPSRISLQRSGAEEVWLSVSPSLQAAGQRTYVTVQVLAPNSQVVAERDYCFDIEDRFDAKLYVPKLVQVTNCGQTEIQAVLQNTGTAADRYTISGSRLLGVTPDELTLAAGESQELKLLVDTSGLEPGQTAISFSVASASGAAGSGETVLDVKACENMAKSTTQEGPTETTISVEVKNEFNRTLENVTASVEGLPQGWTVLLPVEPLTLQPGEAKNITMTIRASTGEEVKNATLVLKEGDKVIARQRLPTISGKPGGLTGFFTAASGNLGLIAAIIVGALVVLVLTGKFEDLKDQLGIGGRDEREAYLEKLQGIREQVERGDRPTTA